MEKRIAIFLGHPAHFHMFKNMANILESKGYCVDFLVKRKDILEDLVKKTGHKYYVVRDNVRDKRSRIGMAFSLLSMELKVIRYLKKHKPSLVIGTYAPILSSHFGVPFIVCCEDDANIVPRFAKTSYPYASAILTPLLCNGGKWDTEIIKYDGYQKLTYLRPNRFLPNESVVWKYFGTNYKPYILMRFAKLNAHHDGGIQGFTDTQALEIIEKYKNRFNFFVTSERELGDKLEAYRLEINPMDIHDLMSFATLYIGDSQSMAVEAAMLGTPSIRFNDFAGKIGVLEELEQKYKLTFGIPSSEPALLYSKIQELLALPNLQEEFLQRRQKMLSDKIDVTAFFTWFIENYPESKRIMKENPDHQYRFR